ncbi:MAG: two-component regulator propeller domain-containing protein, partial [Sphingobacteriales bacterium]
PLNGIFKHYKHDDKNTNSIGGNNILSLNEDDEGNLWVGVENTGVSILKKGTDTFYNYEHDDIDRYSLSENSIYTIYRDRLGNIWLGAFSGGVNLFKKSTKNFDCYAHNSLANSLSNNFVLDLYEDGSHNIWVGTDGGGLNKFSPQNGTFIHFKKDPLNKNSISGNYIVVVNQDYDGDLWVGTWADGISILNAKTHRYNYLKHDPANPNSLGGNNIYAITFTGDKKIWISTFFAGLDEYDKKTNKFNHFQFNADDPQSLGSDMVFSILEDKKKNLWIGTAGGGLELLNRKTNKFTRFQHDENLNSISNNTVQDIFEDHNGNLWLSTFDGLNLFNPQTRNFKIFGKKDGLPGDIVYAVREDNNNMLWISTNNGLSEYDPQTNKFKNFTAEDGLQGNEYKPHSALKAGNGTLYFGGVNGFNSFIPGQILRPEGFLPLVLTGFQVFSKTLAVAKNPGDSSLLKQDISYTKNMTLSYKQSVFSLEFAALDFASRNRKSYAYILEGFDKEWNYIGNRNTASYTNVPQGKYTFKLKYQNASGSWSPVTSELQITIIPPFWLTWWFKLLALLFVTGSVYGFFRNRIEQIKAQKLIIEKQVEERTESLAKKTIEESEMRKSAETAFEKAENAHNALANAAFIQAHELRKPLASIMGLVNVIKASDYEFDPECISKLEISCQELDEKIHAVLAQIEKEFK